MKMSQHEQEDFELSSYAEWEQTVGVEATLEKWDKQRPQRSALRQIIDAEIRERSQQNEVKYGTHC